MSTNSGDIARGREAMQSYFNFVADNFGSDTTLDAFIDKVAKPLKSATIFLDGLGFTIRSIDADSRQVTEAMQALAVEYANNIPPWLSFSQAISKRVSNPNATDYFFGSPQILKGIASDVATGLQRTGNAVLDVAKSFEVIGPVLVVAALIYIGWAYTKRTAGSV